MLLQSVPLRHIPYTTVYDRARVNGVTDVSLTCWRRASRPIRPQSGLGTSLHQSLEGGASFGDLGEAGVRTFKERKKFLVFVDRLVAFSGALVDLAEIVMGEQLNGREAPLYECKVRH